MKRRFHVLEGASEAMCAGARIAVLVLLGFLNLAILPAERGAATEVKDPGTKKLYNEVADKGWIIFSAKSEKGDYDLFVSRPNGSGLRNITRTPEYNELGARFLPDGKRIIYRRVGALKPKVDYRELIYGVLVIANADGSNPRTIGGEGDYPWATLSPDMKQLACLYKKEGKIRIFDFQTLKMVKEMSRQGIFWQLDWSPDGKEFCGTANVEGQEWNIVTYGLESGKVTLISRVLDCTPDWFPDSRGCIFSHRNPGMASDDGGATARKVGEPNPNSYSWTMIMMADRAGKDRKLVVAEQYKHLYFATLSPDNKYVIYSRLDKDAMLAGPMAIIRLADTPIIDGPWHAVEEQYAKHAKRGPVLHLDLPPGFHPFWTFAKLGGK